MNNLRLWVAILALTSFGAGVGAGSFLSAQTHRAVDSQPFDDYHRRFVEQFELSPKRSKALEQLLTLYTKDVDDLQQEHLSRSMAQMQDDMTRLGREYHDYIRNSVLPAHQRDEFDARALAQPWTSP